MTSLALAAALTVSPQAFAQQKAQPSGALQAFMLTTTYGVIAGTLTGLASLAFYENPGERTRNVAIGASLGLYMGILLGAYVVYVPALMQGSPDDDKEEEDVYDDDPIDLGVKMRLLPYSLASAPAGWTPSLGLSPGGNTQFGVQYRF